MKQQLIAGLKQAYLTLITRQSQKKYPVHDNIIYLLSFPTTSDYLLERLYHHYQDRLLICYSAEAEKLAKSYQMKGCQILSINYFPTLLKKVIPQLMGAEVILCDNYFAFLGGISFSKRTKVVQVWHADGAIKKFGHQAIYAQLATASDQKRYKAVYERFTHYVVPSEKMTQIFTDSYQIQQAEFLPFGYPPTDRFFQREWIQSAEKRFKARFSKKTILYLPTYRQKATENPLDFSEMQQKIGPEWQILAQAHPHDCALQEKIRAAKGVITDFGSLTMRELLPFVDCLVTDYSSVAFEYPLAKPDGKLVFFCYDLADYQASVGLQSDFLRENSRRIVQTAAELCSKIIEPEPADLAAFNRQWNQYNQGTAAKQLIDWIENCNET